MFAHSPAVRLVWKTRARKAMITHSETRWRSKWEVLHQVCQYFDNIEPCLPEIDGHIPAKRDYFVELSRTQKTFLT